MTDASANAGEPTTLYEAVQLPLLRARLSDLNVTISMQWWSRGSHPAAARSEQHAVASDISVTSVMTPGPTASKPVPSVLYTGNVIFDHVDEALMALLRDQTNDVWVPHVIAADAVRAAGVARDRVYIVPEIALLDPTRLLSVRSAAGVLAESSTEAHTMHVVLAILHDSDIAAADTLWQAWSGVLPSHVTLELCALSSASRVVDEWARQMEAKLSHGGASSRIQLTRAPSSEGDIARLLHRADVLVTPTVSNRSYTWWRVARELGCALMSPNHRLLEVLPSGGVWRIANDSAITMSAPALRDALRDTLTTSLSVASVPERRAAMRESAALLATPDTGARLLRARVGLSVAESMDYIAAEATDEWRDSLRRVSQRGVLVNATSEQDTAAAQSPHVTAATHPARLRLFASSAAPAERDSTPQPKLWFAILTYNALAYTKRCLTSLDVHTDEPWHAVILDNGSIDGTREWLTAIDDSRITIELGTENRGVAGGRNRLLELLDGRVPDNGYIVFIDNDLEFFPGWLEPFRATLARDTHIGMVSTAGFEMVVHGQQRDLLSYPGAVSMPVDVASGGFACFVRPQVFRDIGKYDEALNPFWHEDDDITVRARAAGWDVYAVPNAAVVHHGHKSGAAIHAVSLAMSRNKQAYLVAKWREQGLVAHDGRLRYGQPSDIDLLGASLARRVGRSSPIRRSEYERAKLDIAQLVRTIAQHGRIAERPRFASTPARALLEEHVTGDSNSSLSVVRDAVQSLLDTRRRTSRLLPRDHSIALGSNKLADSADWDDDAWFAAAIEFAMDGRGRQQWYDRNLDTWQSTQAALQLQRLGVLNPASRLLFVGDVRKPVVWNLASYVDRVTVADLIDRHGAAPESMWMDSPERFASRAVPLDRVRAASVSALAGVFEPLHANAAVLMPWSDDTPIAEVGSLLQMLSRHLDHNAPVTSNVAVRLAGPPDARVLDNISRLPQWLASLGLELIGAVDTSMSDDGLLAATDSDTSDPWTPDLLLADKSRLIGRVSFSCRVLR